MAILLEQEYQFFLSHLDDFLKNHVNEFVLIRGREIVSFFKSYDEALKEGLSRFGNVPFFIKVVKKEEEVHFFHQGLSWEVSKIISVKSPYLHQNGPIYSVVITPSFVTIEVLKLEKKDVPVIKVKALIDTGAQTTAISQKVVDELKLIPRGTAKVYTSQSSKIVNEYDVALDFDSDSYINTLRALGADLQDHSIDCLIGRDVLQHGIFVYDGPNQEFKLTFGSAD